LWFCGRDFAIFFDTHTTHALELGTQKRKEKKRKAQDVLWDCGNPESDLRILIKQSLHFLLPVPSHDLFFIFIFIFS
jgi:hypothetical protein